MFGRRSTSRRPQRGAFSSSKLRNAAIAGAGMLALRWWRNRQTSGRTSQSGEPTGSVEPGQTNWS